MKLNLKCDIDSFEKNLYHITNENQAFLLLDFVVDSDSTLIIKKIGNQKYKVGFSRTLFFNPFKINTFDFCYTFKVAGNKDHTYLSGKVWLKTYVCFFIAFFVLILSFNYKIATSHGTPNIAFYVLAPTIILSYLVVEYIVFKNKIKKILVNLS